MKRPWSLMRGGCDSTEAAHALAGTSRHGLAWAPSAFGFCWRVRRRGASLPSRSSPKRPNEAAC